MCCPRVYFYPLPVEAYPLVRERFNDCVTGTMYGGDRFAETTVPDLLSDRPQSRARIG